MGSDGVTQDFEKARELYQKAADLGDAYAMFELATMCLRGEKKDFLIFGYYMIPKKPPE